MQGDWSPIGFLRGTVYLAAVLCLAASPCFADEFSSKIKRATKDADAADEIYNAAGGNESNLVVVPVPIVDPTMGAGLALASLYTFGTSDTPGSPRSTVAAAAGYTDTDSWLAGAGLNLHLRDDRYRLGLVGGYGEVNLKYYGIGSDSFFANHPIDFSASGGFAEIGAQMRVYDATYIGVKARYLNAEIETKLPIDVLPDLVVPFEMFGVGPTLEYDTRDNSWWPTSGSYAIGELLWYADSSSLFFLNFDQDFRTADASFTHYWGLGDDIIAAAQIRAAVASKHAPFFMNPFVSVRGFPSGAYLDAAVIQTQAELRWKIWNKLGVVAFAGVGATGPEFGTFEDAAIGTGGGLRYRISEVDRMNIGIDLAYGDGDLSLYFRIGEAF